MLRAHGLLLTFPEPDGVEHDPTFGASLEGETGAVFVLLVLDGRLLVPVGLSLTVHFDVYGSLLVFDDQIDPLIEFHAGLGLWKGRAAVRQLDPVTSAFQDPENNHVMADLKGGPARGELRLFPFVSQVTDEFFRDLVEMPHRFQSEMMIALQLFHRLLTICELRPDDQLSVLDFRALGSPALPVQFPVKVVGVDQLSGLEQLGIEFGFRGMELRREREKQNERPGFGNGRFHVSNTGPQNATELDKKVCFFYVLLRAADEGLHRVFPKNFGRSG